MRVADEPELLAPLLPTSSRSTLRTRQLDRRVTMRRYQRFSAAGTLLAAMMFSTSQPLAAQILRIGEMNTQQFQALNLQKTVVLIPGGILEEHGPYLPSYADGYADEAYQSSLGLLPRCLWRNDGPSVRSETGVLMLRNQGEGVICETTCGRRILRTRWCGRAESDSVPKT